MEYYINTLKHLSDMNLNIDHIVTLEYIYTKHLALNDSKIKTFLSSNIKCIGPNP
jgi:hypothetical protein